ncbi:hypothetical protein OHB11_22930 [Streptomyces zaomyceticus]|uniref:hypothetical protein n=1 Tax=Streptomyces zaomyceticus TaxID=68286 RepID=UPI003255B785
MMQIQQGVVMTLAGLSESHEELTEFSRSLLREYHFGNDVELVHQILVEPIGESVELTSLHRITVSVGPDFEDCQEIDIVARILIGESSCSALVAIRADSGASAGEGAGSGEVTLHEQVMDGDLGSSVIFLGKAARSLSRLADPLHPVARRF